MADIQYPSKKVVLDNVKALNKLQLQPPIPIKSKDVPEIIDAFMQTMGTINEEGEIRNVPIEIINFFNELPDELFEESDEDTEETPTESDEDTEETPPESNEDNDDWMAEGDEELFDTDDDPNSIDPLAADIPEEEPKPQKKKKATPKKKATKKKTTPKKKVAKKPVAEEPEEKPEKEPKPTKKAVKKKKKATPKKKATKKKKPPIDSIINGGDFYMFINQIFLSGAITNCRITVKDGFAVCTALSEELTIMATAQIPLNGSLIMDIGDLKLFRNYLAKHKKDDILLQINPKDDRQLLLKTGDNHNTTFKFLMAEVDLLTSYDDSKCALTQVGIDAYVEEYRQHLEVSKDILKSIQDHIVLTKVDVVNVIVDSAGVVSITGGLESEHQFSIDIGILDNHDTAQTYNQFAAVNLKCVIASLDYNKEVTFHFQESEDFVVSNDETFWDFADIIVED
jgi:chemotaxis protein histidine kinase CheA